MEEKKRNKTPQKNAKSTGKENKAQNAKKDVALSKNTKDSKADEKARSRSKSKGGAEDKKKPSKEESKEESKGLMKVTREEYRGTLPKRPKNSFMCFQPDHVKKLTTGGMSHKEAFSKSGEDWQKLSEEQKKPFDDMVQKDIKRYEKEITEINKKGFFKLPTGEKSCDVIPPEKKSRKSALNDDKDEKEIILKPKRATSAYQAYAAVKLKSLKEEHPELAQPMIMKKAGEIWSEMTDKDKAPYNKIADKDKVRLEKDLKMLEEKGYFMMEDGQKSSKVQDEQNKERLARLEAKAAKSKRAKKPVQEETKEEIQKKKKRGPSIGAKSNKKEKNQLDLTLSDNSV